MRRQKSTKKDFFISYNHKDEEAARWIARHLEKVGQIIYIGKGDKPEELFFYRQQNV
jgi:hypothetical protein